MLNIRPKSCSEIKTKPLVPKFHRFAKTQEQILRKIQILSVLAIFSCTTTEPMKIESNWGELSKAGKISCNQWPLKESEIDVSQMLASAGSDGGFIATMRLRNGSQLPVFAEGKTASDLDVEEFIALPIGSHAHVVGLAEWGKEPVAFIIQNRNDRAWLEIRAVRNNRLVSRMPTPIEGDVYSGKISPSAKGWWLQLNHGEADASFVNIVPDVSADWHFSLSPFKALTRFASIVSNGSDLHGHIVETVRGKDEHTSKFKITRLDASGKSKELGVITLPTKGGAESWSAAAIGNRVSLAVVRGDSMIGQASMIVATVAVTGGGLNVEWKQEFPFEDVHLGDPVWISDGTRALLGIMKWIDGEGELSRFRVDAYKADTLGDVGVFEKGTVLMAGYLSEKAGGMGAFRYRDKELWKYKICKLAL